MQNPIAIYGAGGQARETAWLLSSQKEQYTFLGFVEDGNPRTVNGYPVIPWETFRAEYKDALLTIGVGDPKDREMLAQKCEAAGFKFATLIDHGVKISDFVSLGTGTLICAGSIVTVNVKVGRQVHINTACTVAHDTTIGDFTTLSPGVHVSGHVHIGRGVFIGTGAMIINGTKDQPLLIGDSSVIAAGACVIGDVPCQSLYAGVPAILKKRYA